jgi:hypothetical protein
LETPTNHENETDGEERDDDPDHNSISDGENLAEKDEDKQNARAHHEP